MSMSPEDIRAINEARGRSTPAAAPAPSVPSGPLMEIPAEDAAAFGTSTTPVRDFSAEVAAAYASKEAAYGSPEQPVKSGTSPDSEAKSTETGGGGGGGGQAVDPVVGGKRADAKNTIKAVLSNYGLGDLSDYLYGVYAAGTVDINNPDALIFALRGQPAYQKRFAANAVRVENGLAELDPGSYIALENSYRQLLQSNGLPKDFYDSTEDFNELLGGDVSPQELQERVQNGFRAVNDADPEVKRQMKALYNVDEGGLAAYFLDPKRAAPLLTRQADAAKISARAKEQSGIQLLAGTAEDIAARGITAAEAEAGFTKLGLESGLYNEMAGEQALTQQEKVGSVFGYDIEGQKKIAQRKATRKSPFQGGGSFAKTTGTTTGVTQTGLGVAE